MSSDTSIVFLTAIRIPQTKRRWLVNLDDLPIRSSDANRLTLRVPIIGFVKAYNDIEFYITHQLASAGSSSRTELLVVEPLYDLTRDQLEDFEALMSRLKAQIRLDIYEVIKQERLYRPKPL